MLIRPAHGVWLLGAVLLLGGCVSDPAAEQAAEQVAAVEGVDPEILRNLPAGVSAESVEEGRELYVVCSVCHGLDARGTQLGPSLRDTTWIHITGTTDEIGEIIRVGIASPSEFPVPMPVMGGGDFNEQQLQSLVTYVQVLGDALP